MSRKNTNYGPFAQRLAHLPIILTAVFSLSTLVFAPPATAAENDSEIDQPTSQYAVKIQKLAAASLAPDYRNSDIKAPAFHNAHQHALERAALPAYVSLVSCRVDRTGNTSRLTMNKPSFDPQQNFLTLYALATLPPVAMPPEVNGNRLRVAICSEPLVPARAATDKTRAPERLRFPVMPPSFCQAYPTYFKMAEIKSADNWVTISTAICCTDRAVFSVRNPPNLADDMRIDGLFNHWRSFFRNHPHPTKQEILACAAAFKKLYAPLLR